MRSYRVQMVNYLADLDNIVVRLVPIYRVRIVQLDVENPGHSTHNLFRNRGKIQWPTQCQTISFQMIDHDNIVTRSKPWITANKLPRPRAYQTPSPCVSADWLYSIVIARSSEWEDTLLLPMKIQRRIDNHGTIERYCQVCVTVQPARSVRMS